MSDSTAAILEKLGGYHLIKRGEREVKVSLSCTATRSYYTALLLCIQWHRCVV